MIPALAIAGALLVAHVLTTDGPLSARILAAAVALAFAVAILRALDACLSDSRRR